MNPTVTGALIAGAAALIGFAASTWNTRATMRANRQAALDQRLWEKRSALYEDLLRITDGIGISDPHAQEVFDALRARVPQATLYASSDVTVALGGVLEAIDTHDRTGGLLGGNYMAKLKQFRGAVREDIQRIQRERIDRPGGPLDRFRERVRRI